MLWNILDSLMDNCLVNKALGSCGVFLFWFSLGCPEHDLTLRVTYFSDGSCFSITFYEFILSAAPQWSKWCWSVAVRNKRKDLNVTAQANAWLLVWHWAKLRYNPRLARAGWCACVLQFVQGCQMISELLCVPFLGCRAWGPGSSLGSPWNFMANPGSKGRSRSFRLILEPSEVSPGKT